MRNLIIGVSIFLFALSGIIIFKALSIPAGTTKYQNDAEESKTKGLSPDTENIPEKDSEVQSAGQPSFEVPRAIDAISEDGVSGDKAETQAYDNTLKSDEGGIKDHGDETIPVPGDKGVLK